MVDARRRIVRLCCARLRLSAIRRRQRASWAASRHSRRSHDMPDQVCSSIYVFGQAPLLGMLPRVPAAWYAQAPLKGSNTARVA